MPLNSLTICRKKEVSLRSLPCAPGSASPSPASYTSHVSLVCPRGNVKKDWGGGGLSDGTQDHQACRTHPTPNTYCGRSRYAFRNGRAEATPRPTQSALFCIGRNRDFPPTVTDPANTAPCTPRSPIGARPPVFTVLLNVARLFSRPWNSKNGCMTAEHSRSSKNKTIPSAYNNIASAKVFENSQQNTTTTHNRVGGTFVGGGVK